MRVLCPKCGQTIAGGDLNVATDVARCSQCDEVFELSSLVRMNADEPVDLDNPPRGVWYQPEFNGFVVGATTRHPMAFFFVPLVCYWSITSFSLIVGWQIAAGRFDLPLLLVAVCVAFSNLLFWTCALMVVCGKVVVRVCDGEGVVFTGIGPLGWRRRFNALQIKNVRIEQYCASQGPRSRVIVLDGPQKLRFAIELTENRRDFVADVLTQELPRHRRHQSSLNASRSSAQKNLET